MNILKEINNENNLEDNKKEIFKDIKNYEGLYTVSNYGNILNLTTNTLMKFNIVNKFNIVYLFDKNKKMSTYRVHLLVLNHFTKMPEDVRRYIVIHKDKNNLNDKLENLELITNSQYQSNLRKQKQENCINILGEKIKSFKGIHFKQTFNIEEEVEIFKDINGYKNLYKISNHGTVWSLSLDRKMPGRIRGGYLIVKLFDDQKLSKTISIHRLVAEHFCNKPESEKQLIVDHIDNNKINNRYDNLRWTTLSNNSQSYADNFKPKPKNAILQYDSKGKLIKEWECVDDIIKENPKYNKTTLKSYSKENDILYGFRWEYKDDSFLADHKVDLKEDEKFKNCGLIDDRDYSLYEVSNYGTVKNVKTNKYLRPAIGTTGYYVLSFTDQTAKKTYMVKVHRIVANLFVKDKTEEKNVVNHIDEDKLNNSSNNLEWVTGKQNTTHSTGRKVAQISLTDNKTIKIFNSLADAQKSINDSSDGLIKLTNVMGIIRCCQGKKKSSFGYKWKYINSKNDLVNDL